MHTTSSTSAGCLIRPPGGYQYIGLSKWNPNKRVHHNANWAQMALLLHVTLHPTIVDTLSYYEIHLTMTGRTNTLFSQLLSTFINVYYCKGIASWGKKNVLFYFI